MAVSEDGQAKAFGKVKANQLDPGRPTLDRKTQHDCVKPPSRFKRSTRKPLRGHPEVVENKQLLDF